MNKEDEVSRLNRLEETVRETLKNELVEDGLIPFDENVHVHFPSLVDQVVGIITDESLITLDEAFEFADFVALEVNGVYHYNDGSKKYYGTFSTDQKRYWTMNELWEEYQESK